MRAIDTYSSISTLSGNRQLLQNRLPRTLLRHCLLIVLTQNHEIIGPSWACLLELLEPPTLSDSDANPRLRSIGPDT